jgi:hypothetical protein
MKWMLWITGIEKLSPGDATLKYVKELMNQEAL